MMSSTYNYSNALHAARELLQRDGPRGLMRGYWVTNSVWIPYTIMYISAYEVKEKLQPHAPRWGILSLTIVRWLLSSTRRLL